MLRVHGRDADETTFTEADDLEVLQTEVRVAGQSGAYSRSRQTVDVRLTDPSDVPPTGTTGSTVARKARSLNRVQALAGLRQVLGELGHQPRQARRASPSSSGNS